MSKRRDVENYTPICLEDNFDSVAGVIRRKWEDSEFWRVCRRRKEEEINTNGSIKEIGILRITDS